MADVTMRYKHAMLLINGQSPAQILQDRIVAEGTQVDGTTHKLKLHAFMNHQVDCHLMSICGQHLAYRFRGLGANKIIAPRSGVLLAQACAIHLRVPLVIASTVPPVTSSPDIRIFTGVRGKSGVYSEDFTLNISSEFLSSADRVLLLDDVLSSGATFATLVQLVKDADAALVGFGLMIEKEFDGGRHQLPTDVAFEPVVRITAVEPDGEIIFGNADDALPGTPGSPRAKSPLYKRNTQAAKSIE